MANIQIFMDHTVIVHYIDKAIFCLHKYNYDDFLDPPRFINYE